MHKLDPQDYQRAKTLFAGLDHNLTTTEVLEGAAPGPVYVDDPAAPQAAVLWLLHRIYLGGSPEQMDSSALGSLFQEEVIPRLVQSKRSEFLLYYDSDGWEAILEEALGDKIAFKDWRVYCRCRELVHDWRQLLPEGYVLRRIDRALLDESEMEGLEGVVEEIHSERASADSFFSKDFGFCLIQDDRIVAWALSEHNVQDRCEVGIWTLSAHRRRGLALVTASALIEHALAHGISQIGWHAWASNAPSVGLAERLGFEKVLDYPVLFACTDAFASLLTKAWFAIYRVKQPERAVPLFEQAFQIEEPQSGHYYNYACCLALAGRRQEALEALHRAIDKGWSHLEHTQGDPDLASLRELRGWQGVVKRLKELREG